MPEPQIQRHYPRLAGRDHLHRHLGQLGADHPLSSGHRAAAKPVAHELGPGRRTAATDQL